MFEIPDPESGIKVLDFGIAKLLEAGIDGLTATGSYSPSPIGVQLRVICQGSFVKGQCALDQPVDN